MRHGREMSSQGQAKDLAVLRGQLEKAVSGGGSMADRLIGLVTAFADQGLGLDGEFTFGAFKGLMTLFGEGYVPEEGFRQLLGREIASLLKWKFPQTLLDQRK